MRVFITIQSCCAVFHTRKVAHIVYIYMCGWTPFKSLLIEWSFSWTVCHMSWPFISQAFGIFWWSCSFIHWRHLGFTCQIYYKSYPCSPVSPLMFSSRFIKDLNTFIWSHYILHVLSQIHSYGTGMLLKHSSLSLLFLESTFPSPKSKWSMEIPPHSHLTLEYTQILV